MIARMDADPIDLGGYEGPPVRIVDVEGAEDSLPLAKARNDAAASATGDLLVFLDIDCIPSPSLVASYRQALGREDGCFMGEVRYLAIVPPAGEPLDMAKLDRLSSRHVAKSAPPTANYVIEPDHGELWGLSFALTHAAFDRAGGFDERFDGYGGEETDFAMSLKRADIPLYRLANACAYHQYHPIHIPPLQHFDSILSNAERFREKHGRWCMDYWLGQFAEKGLIEWSTATDRIVRLRQPTADEVARSCAPDGTLYS
ncbi:galactosyltransferase-related protein [Notoacmeibacter marinus]|uniref:galactosyltransferase-related protein n=1 Tax=Notoacmeibacter marinus TaxID=1876515 RepID=UPI0019D41E7C|nr:galactosyltransferase-related protein [Notoacmeibacter marinus]